MRDSEVLDANGGKLSETVHAWMASKAVFHCHRVYMWDRANPKFYTKKADCTATRLMAELRTTPRVPVQADEQATPTNQMIYIEQQPV